MPATRGYAAVKIADSDKGLRACHRNQMTEAFSYVRIVTGSEAGVPAICYQVREGGSAGSYLGTVMESEGGWKAAAVVAGNLHLQWHANQDEAARWLQLVAPKLSRPQI